MASILSSSRRCFFPLCWRAICSSALQKNELPGRSYVAGVVSAVRVIHSHGSGQHDNDGGSSILEKIYSQEEKDKILTVLNTASEDEWSLRNITSSIQKGLLIKRPFKSISDVMTVPNMTIVRAEQLCKLSLKPISSAKIKSSQRPKTVKVYPSLEQSDIESIKTVTAIDITPEKTHVVTMTSQLHFISANSISMGLSGKHINLFKFDQATNIDEIKSLLPQLPPTDAFLLQKLALRKNSTKQYLTLYFGRQLVNAVFCSLLAAHDASPKTFSMAVKDIASYYSLNVGSETVSSLQVVLSIIRKRQHNAMPLENVEPFQQMLSEMDTRSDEIESMCSLFLQCILFITEHLNKTPT